MSPVTNPFDVMTMELTGAERESLADRLVATAEQFGLDLLHSEARDLADAAYDEGWVSPEEAKARGAAARREVLLEARDYLSEQEQFDAAELVRTLLAEPERDDSRH